MKRISFELMRESSNDLWTFRVYEDNELVVDVQVKDSTKNKLYDVIMHMKDEK